MARARIAKTVAKTVVDKLAAEIKVWKVID
jgi:hypothetical protein